MPLAVFRCHAYMRDSSAVGRVVMVTQGPLRRLTLRDDLYVGGYVNYSATGLLQLSRRKRRLQGIVGCIRSLQISDNAYDMSRGAFIGDALRHVNIGMLCIAKTRRHVHFSVTETFTSGPYFMKCM